MHFRFYLNFFIYISYLFQFATFWNVRFFFFFLPTFHKYKLHKTKKIESNLKTLAELEVDHTFLRITNWGILVAHLRHQYCNRIWQKVSQMLSSMWLIAQWREKSLVEVFDHQPMTSSVASLPPWLGFVLVRVGVEVGVRNYKSLK